MKRALAAGMGAIALAALVAPIRAPAAELELRRGGVGWIPAVTTPPRYNWTSCYIGGNAGRKWGRFEGSTTIGAFDGFPPTTFVFPPPQTRDFDKEWMGGGQVGCQWQTGNVLLGAEGDFDRTRIRQLYAAPALAPFGPGDSIFLQNDWQGSVRGRLGWIADRWLFYATAGAAFAKVEATANLAPFPPVLPGAGIFTQDRRLHGATGGGGMEFAFSSMLSFAVEYRFTKYRDENFSFGAIGVTPAPGVAGVTGVTNLRTHEVTARLNLHLGCFGTSSRIAGSGFLCPQGW